MNKILVIIIFTLISYSASADSFRCKGKIVKSGDTVNALLKKCGDADRTFQTTETVLKSTLRIMSMSVAERRT